MQRLILPAVALAALAVRLVPLLAGPGLLDWDRYDDGVYYTAAASLLDGRLPYHDFVLLHPPLIMLALTPFALLGRLTSDATGFLAARLVWALLGTAIAVLAARLAGRWGTVPALIAGLWVACSASASYAAQSTFIEPVADLALLGGIALLTCDHERPRHELVAGVLLGIALTGKIWYVVPVAVLLLVTLAHRRLRTVLRAGSAAALTATAILLPFFAAAPGDMWRMVVRDQLTRPPTMRATLLERLSVGTAGRYLGLDRHSSMVVTTAAVALVLAAAVTIALLDRLARPIAAVALANGTLLLLSPSSFRHYGSLAAAPVGLTLGIGLSLLGTRILGTRILGTRGPGRVVVALALGVLAAGGVLAISHPDLHPFDRREVAALLPDGCITSDDPTTLILTDRLSNDLRAGCPMPVDITGHSYGVGVRRNRDQPYLTWLDDYLTSGSAMILDREHEDGLERPETSRLGALLYAHRDVRVMLPASSPGAVRDRRSWPPTRTRRTAPPARCGGDASACGGW